MSRRCSIPLVGLCARVEVGQQRTGRRRKAVKTSLERAGLHRCHHRLGDCRPGGAAHQPNCIETARPGGELMAGRHLVGGEDANRAFDRPLDLDTILTRHPRRHQVVHHLVENFAFGAKGLVKGDLA